MQMRQTATFFAALTALTGIAGVCAAQSGDLYARLRSYDSQDRKAISAIREQIQTAGGDKVKRAAIETGLATALDDTNATFAGKQEATRLLWTMGATPLSIPSLAKMLLDPKLNDVARYALESSPDPAAATALRDALAKTTGASRIGVINSLGDRADAKAVGVLTPLAADSDKATVDAAIAALGKIGTLDALKALDSLKVTELDQVEKRDRAIIRAADRLAASGNKRDARQAYAVIAARPMSEPLREEATHGLRMIDPKAAGTLSLDYLLNSQPDSEAAANLVAGITDPGIVSKAMDAYPKLSPATQVILLSGWSANGIKAAQPHAEKAITSDNAMLRTAGLKAVANLAGASSVPMLAKAAATGADSDRNTARTMLTTMPGQDAETAIIKAAGGGDDAITLALINVLSDRGTARSRAFLTGASFSGKDRYESEAIKGLARISEPEDYSTLVKSLVSTKSDSVRDAAQSAVVTGAQRLGDKDKATAPLIAALPTAPAPTQASLLQAMAEIGGDNALNTLTKAVESPDASVRNAARVALAETWADERARPTLLKIATPNPAFPTTTPERVQALRGYIRLLGTEFRASDDERVTQLKEAIRLAERPDEKKQALGVLRDVRTEFAVATAARLLTDEAVFPEAADTVLYLAAPQRKDDRDLPAVKGSSTTAALDAIIRLTKDPELKAKAEKLR